MAAPHASLLRFLASTTPVWAQQAGQNQWQVASSNGQIVLTLSDQPAPDAAANPNPTAFIRQSVDRTAVLNIPTVSGAGSAIRIYPAGKP